MNSTTDLIKAQIDKIPELRDLAGAEDPKFKQWNQVVRAILEKKLGKEKAENFPGLYKFWPHRIGPWDEGELKESLLNGLNDAEAYLNGIIQEIELLGEDNIEDSNPLPSSKTFPKLNFGKAGVHGQPGGGGSIFIQTENFTMNGNGQITANGGNSTVYHNEIQNFGTINQTTADAINNTSKLTNVVNDSDLSESEKRQLIGDIETIKAQLIKPNPNKSILEKAWSAIQTASTIGGAVQLLTMIGQVVIPLIK